MTRATPDRGPGIRVPPPLIYLAGFSAGVAIERIAPSLALPRSVRTAGGAAAAVLFLALDTRAMARFRRHRTPFNPARPARTLVTDGPYSFTRNPMYVGMACAHAGAALAANSVWSLALLAPTLAILDRAIVPREEAHLAISFGEDYERYRSSVPRWLPDMRRRRRQARALCDAPA